MLPEEEDNENVPEMEEEDNSADQEAVDAEENLPDLEEMEPENTPTFLQNPFEIQCPVCDHMCSVDHLVLHLMTTHPRFFVVWSAYSMPWMNTNEAFDDDEDLFQDYNYLTNLCESIGYHKEGIKNMDDVTIVTAENEHASLNERCPICMDELFSNDPVVRITKKCNHGFCAMCLETWLSQNKTCPICMQWLLDETPETQTMTFANPTVSLEEVD